MIRVNHGTDIVGIFRLLGAAVVADGVVPAIPPSQFRRGRCSCRICRSSVASPFAESAKTETENSMSPRPPSCLGEQRVDHRVAGPVAYTFCLLESIFAFKETKPGAGY